MTIRRAFQARSASERVTPAHRTGEHMALRAAQEPVTEPETRGQSGESFRRYDSLLPRQFAAAAWPAPVHRRRFIV